MTNSFDTIVVGLGAMGSATLYQLAQRGVKALGIDLLAPPHSFGSSHGDTRITRQAIGEGDHYTPLSLRSYEIFREMEKRSGSKLLEVTGGLIISGSVETASINHIVGFFDNTVAAAKRFGIKHELLTPSEVRLRFPQFNVDDDENGYFEPEAAFLKPEEVIRVQLQLAKQFGATIHTNESFISFEEGAHGVEIYTDKGSYTADKVVLSAGPWLPQLLPQYQAFLKAYRQVLYWFDVSDAADQFVPGKFPVFIWQIKGTDNGIYGFPAVDGPNGGFKIASENYVEVTTPETVNRIVSLEETESMYKLKVAPYFPLSNSKCLRSSVCLYTVTPDSGFVIDWLPSSSKSSSSSSKRVILCSPCSGHGFKHAAAIGESIAEMTTVGHSRLDMSAFKLERFGSF